MTQPTAALSPHSGERHSAAPPAPVDIDSARLMNGRRELLIRHGDHTYRLRVTASNKLILTK